MEYRNEVEGVQAFEYLSYSIFSLVERILNLQIDFIGVNDPEQHCIEVTKLLLQIT